MLINITNLALKQLEQLEPHVKKRIKIKLEWYLSHEDPLVFAGKLTDFELGQYRYRIGEYRVIFDVIKDTIIVHRICHRKSAYQ
jgi:mRNA interferase RelE/StbE